MACVAYGCRSRSNEKSTENKELSFHKKVFCDATAQDIDTGMKLGAGLPMGPLELADFTGLDLKKYILNIMLEKTGHPVFKPIGVLDRLVAEGKYGRKTGEGIYKYDENMKKIL